MKKKPLTLKINGHDPDKKCVRKAVEVCKKGKVIAFPTETVYAVGGRMHASGIEKQLREITGRPETEPFIYYISDWSMLDTLKIKRTPLVCSMASQFWPGPVTLIVFDLQGKKIGIRFPRNKIALAVIRETGEPLIAAGANRRGKPAPHTAHQVLEGFPGDFDCLIDGGKTELRSNSTIVDLTGENPVVLRKGAHGSTVEKAVLKIQAEKCPRKRILIVCTGNACRSPMAEGLLRQEIEKKGLSGDIEVSSCGTHARDGVPCTSETEIVMRNREIDLSKFRSRLCRGRDLWAADLIFAMAPQHARDIAKRLPSVKTKMITLNVDDPIGMGMVVYEKTFHDIETKLKQHRNTIFRLDPAS